ncbi:hypothetical protein [Halobacillus sp. BBL2006]|uniref:hypothetical protein n=1 Tax=Halobacillus sp. BBL2006 TaxID=1543706 RepID=UPI00054206CB|nr:hypothetical protein [Halobacillus sp. BBL2006]KHE72351.1 hypothetical protein LD39_04975 [Halobacillus sp. BBL2006]
MRLLGLKLFNLASYMYLLVASFFLAGNFTNRSTDDVLVMPAPFAFSIWFLIYLLLLIFVFTSFFANEEMNEVVRKIGLWFPLSMILSGTSVVVGTTPSILFLALSLLTLCVVYTVLQSFPGLPEKYRASFSIYLAWTSIATIVDAFVVLKANKVEELFSIGELGWSVILLTIGGLIAIAFHFYHNDYFFPLVFVWGYGAIFAYQENSLIRFITGAFVIILLFIVLFSFLRKRN